MGRITDIAWLAGIVDGEGYLAFSKSVWTGRKNPGYSALLKVGMYHQETIERMASIVGGNAKSRLHPNYDKTIWECTVQGGQLAPLLRELLPHLTTKRIEALLLLEAIAQCPSRNGVLLTDEEAAMREGFYLVLRSAKAA